MTETPFEFVGRAVDKGNNELGEAQDAGGEFLETREYQLLKVAVLTTQTWWVGRMMDPNGTANVVPLTLAIESAEAILGEKAH